MLRDSVCRCLFSEDAAYLVESHVEPPPRIGTGSHSWEDRSCHPRSYYIRIQYLEADKLKQAP
jgi:hypothetical protein